MARFPDPEPLGETVETGEVFQSKNERSVSSEQPVISATTF